MTRSERILDYVATIGAIVVTSTAIIAVLASVAGAASGTDPVWIAAAMFAVTCLTISLVTCVILASRIWELWRSRPRIKKVSLPRAYVPKWREPWRLNRRSKR